MFRLEKSLLAIFTALLLVAGSARETISFFASENLPEVKAYLDLEESADNTEEIESDLFKKAVSFQFTFMLQASISIERLNSKVDYSSNTTLGDYRNEVKLYVLYQQLRLHS